jgi:hypothetical protein
MAKVKMLVELDYDAETMHSGDKCKESKQWFMETILLDKAGLILHSNEIGDTLGVVHVIDVHPF